MDIKYYGDKITNHIAKTPEGFLICQDVPISRTGYQTYLSKEMFDNPANGHRAIPVYRPADEVFNVKSLASFEGKPVTNEHPDEDVTPENYSQYACGHVQNVHVGTGQDSNKVLADLYITDPKLIYLIQHGKREISCGYYAEERRDASGRICQTRIRGNHVAVVKNGRAGKNVCIRDENPFYQELENAMKRRKRNYWDEDVVADDELMDEDFGDDDVLVDEDFGDDDLSMDEDFGDDELMDEDFGDDDLAMDEDFGDDDLAMDEDFGDEDLADDDLALDEDFGDDDLSVDEGCCDEDLADDDLAMDEDFGDDDLATDEDFGDDDISVDEDYADDDILVDKRVSKKVDAVLRDARRVLKDARRELARCRKRRKAKDAIILSDDELSDDDYSDDDLIQTDDDLTDEDYADDDLALDEDFGDDELADEDFGDDDLSVDEDVADGCGRDSDVKDDDVCPNCGESIDPGKEKVLREITEASKGISDPNERKQLQDAIYKVLCKNSQMPGVMKITQNFKKNKMDSVPKGKMSIAQQQSIYDSFNPHKKSF